MLKSIQKYTSESHSDYLKLQESIEICEDTIKLVDQKTGLAKCEFVKSKFDFLSEIRVCICGEYFSSLLILLKVKR